MKIAVIGAGSAGLMSTWVLNQKGYEVDLYEESLNVRGFSNTINLPNNISIDNGLIIYPENEVKMFWDRLGVSVNPVAKEIAVFRRQDWSRAFHLFNKSPIYFALHYKLKIEQKRFHDIFLKFHIKQNIPEMNTAQFFETYNFSNDFIHKYIYPIRVTFFPHIPLGQCFRIPLQIFYEVYMSYIFDVSGKEIKWVSIKKGGSHLTQALIDNNRTNLRLNTSIKSVSREDSCVSLVDTENNMYSYDEVVFTIDADKIPSLVTNLDKEEQKFLSSYQYLDLSSKVCSISAEHSFIPKSVCSVCFYKKEQSPMVILNLNRVNNIDCHDTDYFVSYNNQLENQGEVEQISYRHDRVPIYNMDIVNKRHLQKQFIRRNRISFVGCYWGKGNQADSVKSVLLLENSYQTQLV